MNDTASRSSTLAGEIRSLLGDHVVTTDPAEREAFSSDVYSAGITCAMVIRPVDKAGVAQAVESAGFGSQPGWPDD